MSILPRNWSIRGRLTVLYGGLFFLAGAVLLALTYVLVRQGLNARLGTGTDQRRFEAGPRGTRPEITSTRWSRSVLSSIVLTPAGAPESTVTRFAETVRYDV